VRLAGGLLYLSGMFMMAWNTWKTWAVSKMPEPVLIPAAVAA